MHDGQDRLKKLRWKSRRGMKELDVLLEAFFEAQADKITAGGWPQLEDFLSREDDVLFDWISGRNLPNEPGLRELIVKLAHA
jgi:antitoxin CptB